MKKVLLLCCVLLFGCFNSQAFAIDSDCIYLSYKSATSLKYEINSLNRKIKSNQYKIRSIKTSRSISENEKRRRISRLENQNNYLKRKVRNIKSQYQRAIS